jgi:hypothetical protein
MVSSLGKNNNNNNNKPQSTTCKGNLFKPRKLIINKANQATFWGIFLFKDTFL